LIIGDLRIGCFRLSWEPEIAIFYENQAQCNQQKNKGYHHTAALPLVIFCGE